MSGIIAVDQLRLFIERIETIEAELDAAESRNETPGDGTRCTQKILMG